MTGADSGPGHTGALTIALICPYSLARIGGVQNQVLELAGWLTGQGHRVHLLAPDAPSPESLARNGLPAQVHTSSGRSLAVGFNGSTAPIGPGGAGVTRRWLRQVRPDVVHVHEPMVPGPALTATRLARGIPTVGTFHAALSAGPLPWLGRRLRWIPARLAVATAVSATARDSARHTWGIATDVVPNGFRRDDFLGGDVAAGRPTRVTFLGRIDDPRKGFDVFAAAVPLIRRDVAAELPGTELDLVVAGPGSERIGVRAGELRGLGAIGDAERGELLRGSRVLVAPNTRGESFGLVLAEAMAAGAEVIAADLPAFSTLLDGGRFGHLVGVGDPVGLARAVTDVLVGRRDDRRAAARNASSAWDWNRVGPELVARYRYAITGHRSTRIPGVPFGQPQGRRAQ